MAIASAIEDAVTQAKSSATPTNPMGGIIAGAQAAAPAAPVDQTQRINDIFQRKFGRKAADAGVTYWSSVANKDPSADLESLIVQGAQTQDKAAMADIGNGGIDTSKTWTPGLNESDVASQKDVWDDANNRWVSTSATPAAYKPTLLADPTKWNVSKDQTVAGQMEKYSDPNNAYVQQWGTQGAQEAAARGFTGDSSIRSTGILDSVMRNATPIATADAATQAKAAGYNTDEANQFEIANQNASNTGGAFNAAQANTMSTSLSNAQLSADSQKYASDKSAATQLGVTDKNNATALAQSGMSAETQLAVAKLNTASQAEVSKAHDANSALLASNSAAKDAYASYVNAVGTIDLKEGMNADAKAAAIATQTQIFNNAIAGIRAATPGTADISSPLDLSSVKTGAAAVQGVDVSQYLNF